MRGLRRIASGSSVAILLVAGLTGWAGRAGATTDPGSDPFYVPPANYAARPNGAVLRVRTIEPLALGLPMLAHGTQILFRSIDSRGNPTADATSVLVPDAAWTGHGPRPIVSYQTAEDGVGNVCEPSYALQAGLAAGSSNAELETPLMALLLAQGWAVVTTDYEGPHSQFLAGPQEGYAVLDGIRAALAQHPDGLSSAAPVALWGYSGGAFATAWAMHLRASHAPRLQFAGAALGGLPADLLTTMHNVDGGYGFGLVLGGLIGIARANPQAKLFSLLNARGVAAFQASKAACTLGLVIPYAFQRLSSFTVSAQPYGLPALRALLVANSPGPATTSAPIYDYHATADELVPLAVANGFVSKDCHAGDRVQIVRTSGGSHNTELLTGAPGAISFLAQRFAGEPAVNNCP
jgi:hypothetical protein